VASFRTTKNTTVAALECWRSCPSVTHVITY
jgi:hypothetical protein